MLQTGIRAPAFTLPDENGTPVSLSGFAGQKVLLYFYPKDNTGGCTKQALGYTAHAGEFAEKGVKVLGVSKDSAESHRKFIEKQALTVTLLSDPERTAIEAYDVWQEKKLYGKVSMGVKRTTYLIDENGMIVFANDKVKAAEDAKFMLAQV